ncbi:MAG: hypothetical protein H0V47_07755 [Chloroflexia bacterium]|jgi:putative nucleotidyltransferase with HDIG domain|nr:hypothetical protein [Chloroflexia bacterium]
MTYVPAVRKTGQGVAWRVIQGFRTMAYRHDSEIDRRLHDILQNEAQWRLLLRLSAFDRAHHLRVHDTLIAAGHVDADLLRAAALHDAGKADDRGRVRLPHRVLKVFLQATSPWLLGLTGRRDGGWLGHGLFLARHHAQLGAQLAETAGASERCVELIARHEENPPVDDPHLRALIQADAGAIA